MMMTSSASRPWTDWEEVRETDNKVIKGAIEQDFGYFEPKIDNILKHTCNISGNKYESAFLKLIIDDQIDNKPLKYVEEYIVKNREEGNILKAIADSFKALILALLEKSVENENWDSLQNILNWFENIVLEHKDMHRLTLLWQASCAIENFDNVVCNVKRNNLAMIRACEKDNFEMVLSFLQFGYSIDQKEIKKYQSETKSVCYLLCRNYEKLGDDMLYNFRQLQATSKPAFMIAQFRNKIDQEYEELNEYDPNVLDLEYRSSFENEDPLTVAFCNVSKVQELVINNVEYASKFEQIENENKKFAVEMLNLCKTSEEAEIILSNDLSRKNSSNNMAYPRIEAAIRTKNTEFVAHDFCQQVLRKKLLKSEMTGMILQWSSASKIDKAIYIISCVTLMPFHFIIKCLQDVYFRFRNKSETEVTDADVESFQLRRKNEETSCSESFYSFPMHRFIAHATSSLFFLAILIAQMLLPDNRCFPPIVMAYAVSYLVYDLQRYLANRPRGPCNINNLSDELSFWNIYNISNDLLLLSGSVIMTYIQYFCTEEERNDVKWKDGYLSQIEACLNGMAVTMAVMKLLYWCQLSSWLGPLAISIRMVFKDVAMVLASYIIFFVAFTLGIHFIMSVPVPMEDPKCGDDDTKNNFRSLFRFLPLQTFTTTQTFTSVQNVTSEPNSTPAPNGISEIAWKTALWAFFDPGHPEYLGCYYGFARSTALTLWGIYQVVNVIMLMPLMVALMSTTMALIDSDKDHQWKFQRTEIWLRFFDYTGLPAPLNIIDHLLNWNCRKVENQKQKKLKKQERMKYINLVSKLSRRYIQRMEDSDVFEATREDLENAKRDVLNKLKRASSL